MLEILIKKVLDNPNNARILSFLSIDLNGNIHLSNGNEISGYDEGGIIFFREYAKDLPSETKYLIDGNNVLINKNNGLIFGCHFGRFTFIFRCDFEINNIENSDKQRMGYTLDDWIDVKLLGEDWALLNNFYKDESQQLQLSYNLSFKNVNQ